MNKSDLKLVNSFVENSFEFQDELVDIWYTFAESIARGSGDCDDFSMAKREVLLLMGVPDEDMTLISGGLLRGRFRGDNHMALRIDNFVLCNIYGVQPYDRYQGRYMKVQYELSFFGFYINSTKVWEREETPKWQRYQLALEKA